MTGDGAESTERTTGNGPDEEDAEMRATGGTFRTFVVAVLSILGTLAAMPMATAAQGNSDAAHACQQGGWQSLVREDGSGFGNQGECVSYAAQGGTPSMPDNRGISLSWTWRTQHFGYSQYEICYAHVTLTNFPAGEHTVQLTVDSGIASNDRVSLTIPVGADGTGTADTSRANGEGLLGAWYASTEPGDENIDQWQAVVTATTADGLATTSNASCQRPS